MKGKQFTRFYFKIPVGCDNTYYTLQKKLRIILTDFIQCAYM